MPTRATLSVRGGSLQRGAFARLAVLIVDEAVLCRAPSWLLLVPPPPRGTPTARFISALFQHRSGLTVGGRGSVVHGETEATGKGAEGSLCGIHPRARRFLTEQLAPPPFEQDQLAVSKCCRNGCRQRTFRMHAAHAKTAAGLHGTEFGRPVGYNSSVVCGAPAVSMCLRQCCQVRANRSCNCSLDHYDL